MPACLASSSEARFSWISARVFAASARVKRALRLLDVGLEQVGLDLEEGLAGLDRLAFLEQHGLKIALHPRPDLHLFHRIDAADEFGALGHFLHFRRNHADPDRRLRLRRAAPKKRRAPPSSTQTIAGRVKEISGVGTSGHGTFSSLKTGAPQPVRRGQTNSPSGRSGRSMFQVYETADEQRNRGVDL